MGANMKCLKGPKYDQNHSGLKIKMEWIQWLRKIFQENLLVIEYYWEMH